MLALTAPLIDQLLQLRALLCRASRSGHFQLLQLTHEEVHCEFCAFDAVDTLIGVIFTRDTSSVRSFLFSSSTSCLHSKGGFVPTLLCFVLLSAVLYC